MNNVRRALLVGVTEEQKNPVAGNKDVDTSSVQWKILLRIEELYSKENDVKKVIDEMDTITDKYDEAVDRATCHLTVVKPKLSSMEIESTTQRNIFGRRGWFSQQENSNEKT